MQLDASASSIPSHRYRHSTPTNTTPSYNPTKLPSDPRLHRSSLLGTHSIQTISYTSYHGLPKYLEDAIRRHALCIYT